MKINQLLLETPDSIEDAGANWYDDDNITFTLVDDYYVYDKSTKLTHSHLIIYLIYMCDPERYKDKIDPNMFKNVISNLDEKWCESDVAKHLLAAKYADRNSLLEDFPGRVSQGRLWIKRNLISCWDHPKDLKNIRHKIINIISIIGDNPQSYKYEVEGVLLSYEDFKAGNFETDVDELYDRQALHLLSPEIKKRQLLAMGAKPKMKNAQYSYSTFGDSLNKALINLICDR